MKEKVTMTRISMPSDVTLDSDSDSHSEGETDTDNNFFITT